MSLSGVVLSLVSTMALMAVLASSSPYPYTICPDSPTDFNITAVIVSPSPPARNQPFFIFTNGTVDEIVKINSTVQLSVFYNGHYVIDYTFLWSAGAKLPAGPGIIDFLLFPFTLPDVGDGHYEVDLVFMDSQGKTLTCVALSFTFRSHPYTVA